jgi:hypothetical protein
MSRKPSVASADWHSLICDDNVSVWEDTNNYSFLKVKIKNDRVKYFYGENSPSNASRYISDKLGIFYHVD